MKRKGLVVVISAPSGTGKGTLLAALKNVAQNMKYSISVTTRIPRAGEVDGRDYFFTTHENFQKMIDDNMLLEWDSFVGNYYGTPREYIENCVNEGYDVYLDITVKGALQIKQNYNDCVLIFMLPPSFNELQRRITSRGTETQEVIKQRLEQAKEEIDYLNKYDYVIINDNVDNAVNDVLAIVHAEKLKVWRNSDIGKRLGFY